MSAKITWGLKLKALKTIYTGAILPIILYGAPIWKDVMKRSCYKAKIVRIQRLININPLNPELNPLCYLLALLAHHFLHVSRIRVKSLTLRLLMSYIWSTYS